MKTKGWGLCILMVLTVPALCLAGEFQGKIIKSKGDVVIRDKSGHERSPEQSDYIAVTDEKVNTLDGGRAVVKFTNGSLTVIGENSSLGIEKPTLFAHLKGKILFAFNKSPGPTRMVRTPSAVFGVRATTFLVGQDDNGETMALKEGLVHVEAPEGAFEIHKKKDMDEFDALKADMEQGVTDMKQEGDAFIQQQKDDYVAFKKSFLVKPDQSIRINGNRVDHGPMDDSDKAAFEDLERFADDLLSEFKSEKDDHGEE